MSIDIPRGILEQIHANGETAYPEEGAGLMLGRVDGEHRRVRAILELENAREDESRHNRYLLTAQDMLRAELKAMQLDLDIIGIFHSHPDHPNCPSEFDREWAMPWFSYVITSVNHGNAIESRSWLLSEDRLNFNEEKLDITVNREA